MKFRQTIHVAFKDMTAFRASPLEYVRSIYQAGRDEPDARYTSMCVICSILSASVGNSEYDLFDGASVQMTLVALVYQPGGVMLVHLSRGKSGELVGRLVEDHIKSTVRLLDPPAHINLTNNFLQWVKVEDWQCQIMDKLVVIGRTTQVQPARPSPISA